jgi:hypothetical protein
MAPLTAAQLLEHPEYPKVIWDLEPTQKGTIPVAHGRGGPFDISYEVHGTGDICLVVCSMFRWSIVSTSSQFLYIVMISRGLLALSGSSWYALSRLLQHVSHHIHSPPCFPFFPSHHQSTTTKTKTNTSPPQL